MKTNKQTLHWTHKKHLCSTIQAAFFQQMLSFFGGIWQWNDYPWYAPGAYISFCATLHGISIRWQPSISHYYIFFQTHFSRDSEVWKGCPGNYQTSVLLRNGVLAKSRDAKQSSMIAVRASPSSLPREDSLKKAAPRHLTVLEKFWRNIPGSGLWKMSQGRYSKYYQQFFLWMLCLCVSRTQLPKHFAWSNLRSLRDPFQRFVCFGNVV